MINTQHTLHYYDYWLRKHCISFFNTNEIGIKDLNIITEYASEDCSVNINVKVEFEDRIKFGSCIKAERDFFIDSHSYMCFLIGEMNVMLEQIKEKYLTYQKNKKEEELDVVHRTFRGI